MPDFRPALLFFSHRPAREWRNKRFVPHDRAKTRQVAEALYDHTLDAAEASGLPVLEVTDAEQRGATFGDRLANAFRDAFAAGYTHVIAVGSDCPSLDAVDWTDVLDRLTNGAPVLGPTSDGAGTYLIGLHRTQFDADAFAALPWQSPHLLDALTDHLSARTCAPDRLKPRADVNGHGDLLLLLRTCPTPTPLCQRLRDILGRLRPGAAVSVLTSSLLLRRHTTRGPPVPSAPVE